MHPPLLNVPDIIYEDKHIIVCRKPAGTAVQSARVGTQDMVSILKNYLSQQTGTSNPYLAVIHRLDQPVEGLLVFAKDPRSAAALNRQMTGSGFGKYYYVVTSASPVPSEGVLANDIVKDARSNTSRICPPGTPGSKKARLSYRLLRQLPCGTLLEIHLDTGRHHQIRVQMAHIGCPLVGDRKYGGAENVNGLMLCAFRLEFTHPVTGEMLTFQYEPAFLSESALS